MWNTSVGNIARGRNSHLLEMGTHAKRPGSWLPGPWRIELQAAISKDCSQPAACMYYFREASFCFRRNSIISSAIFRGTLLYRAISIVNVAMPLERLRMTVA